MFYNTPPLTLCKLQGAKAECLASTRIITACPQTEKYCGAGLCVNSASVLEKPP